MSSGMNMEQAKEYAKTMTYKQAVGNVFSSRGIKYRKATMIKLRELAEIADRLDRKTESDLEKPNNCETCKFAYITCRYEVRGEPCRYEPKTEPQTMYYPQVDGITPSVIKTEPQTERLCDNCEHYGGGEVCDHPSIGEVEMGGKGDTFPWTKETPKWCPLKDEPQTDCAWAAPDAPRTVPLYPMKEGGED